MLYQSYVVWNNKGGVGKTTLTFHLSTEYAIQNPDNKYIIVIDMCPQANISAALLSNLDADMNGTAGYVNLQNITTQRNVRITSTEGDKFFAKSVCGYLLAKLDNTITGDILSESFLVQPINYNHYITGNVHLLCGDPYLEVLAKRLEQERQQIAGDNNPWKRVTLFIKDFIDQLSQRMEKDIIVFIDTNPSFSIYTELAISGAKRIIVPINADDFSRMAVTSMLYLLYGIVIGDMRDEVDAVDRDLEFHILAGVNGINIPKIHLIINNKITPYNTRSAQAFSAKAEEVSNLIVDVLQEHPHIFVELVDRMGSYEYEMNDFHTKAVQCLHLGCPLSKLPSVVTMSGNINVRNPGRTGDNYLPNLLLIIARL